MNTIRNEIMQVVHEELTRTLSVTLRSASGLTVKIVDRIFEVLSKYACPNDKSDNSLEKLRQHVDNAYMLLRQAEHDIPVNAIIFMQKSAHKAIDELYVR